MKGFENYKMKEFAFTSSSDEIIPLSKFEKDLVIKKNLNKFLTLNKYSDKYTSLFTIYQAFAPDDIYSQYKEKKRFRRKTKVMELYLNLDYHKFLKADNKTALQMMAELFLKGINKFLSTCKDFDHELFYKDVKKLFEKEGILENKQN